MKAIGYVRVSTDKQADRGLSLEAQQEKVRAMSVVKGVGIVDDLIEIVDPGASGKSLEREGMQRVLELVQKRAVDMVMVAKLDRLTRSVRDLAVLLEQFERKGVTLVSVAESLDTGSASGRLVLNIMMSVSQWEREAIGERTRDVMQMKIRRAEYVGNCAFGQRCTDGRHVEAHPGEQKILADIRRLRKEGTSLRQIAARLNAQGFRTRSDSPSRHEYVARVLRSGKNT